MSIMCTTLLIYMQLHVTLSKIFLDWCNLPVFTNQGIMVVWKVRKGHWLVLIYNFLFEDILEFVKTFEEFVINI